MQCGSDLHKQEGILREPQSLVPARRDSQHYFHAWHELEGMYCITYDSWEGYYIVHTPKGEVRFHKDKQGLPYLDLEESSEAAVMLLQ